jgi:hypothetical protein
MGGWLLDSEWFLMYRSSEVNVAGVKWYSIMRNLVIVDERKVAEFVARTGSAKGVGDPQRGNTQRGVKLA